MSLNFTAGDYRDMADYLRTLSQFDGGDVGDDARFYGICGLFHEKFGFRLRKAIDGRWMGWPDYSGNTAYPVPCTPDVRDVALEYMDCYGGFEEGQEFQHELHEAVFEGTTNLWLGEYGDKRRELAAYLADQLDAKAKRTESNHE